MQELTLLQDLALVMIVSAVVTILCHQFRLPVVLGYIVAGIIVGPHTPPYSLVTDVHSIHLLSELGVIFLLFGIGLEFSISKLMKVGLVSSIAATLEIFLMLWIGFLLGRFFGWNFMNSLFLGAILSISSTTIISKILMDTKKLQERFAQIILGILVIEDLLAIIIIAVLSGLAFTGEFSVTSVFSDLIKVGGFIAGVLFFGKFLLPRILSYIHTFKSSEMMVIAVLGLCFGTSLLAAKFGFSIALGAFLIGAVMAETKQAKFIIRHFESIRDMFTAVFFVSVGMLFDPHILVQFAGPILIITAITIIGKVIACSFATFLTGDKPTTALKVGLGLAQIGEFSFIIARLGESSNVTSSFIFPIAVAVSSLTTISTPLLMKYTDNIVHAASRWVPQPIATFGGLYLQWIKSFQLKEEKVSRRSVFLKGLKTYLLKILFYTLVLIFLINLPSEIVKRFTVSLRTLWLINGVLMLPFLFGLLSSLEQLIWQTLSPSVSGQKEEMYEKEAKDVLHNVIRLVLILILGLVVLTISSFFISTLPLNIIVATLIGLVGILLWESIRKVHERVEKTILGFLDKETPAKTHKQIHDELIHMIQEDYPWGVETQDFLLPYQECALNQEIKDIALRSHSGATIVAIYRDEETIVNPKPDTILMPGDVLLLMGSKEQVQKALKFLAQKIKEPRPV